MTALNAYFDPNLEFQNLGFDMDWGGEIRVEYPPTLVTQSGGEIRENTAVIISHAEYSRPIDHVSFTITKNGVQVAAIDTYVIPSATAGQIIFGTETAFDADDNVLFVLNTYEVTILAAMPAEWSPLPSVSGAAPYGSTITANPGTMAGATFTYQWLKDGADIAGQIASTWVSTIDMVGKFPACRVTATVGAASASRIATSATAVTDPLVIDYTGYIPANKWNLVFDTASGGVEGRGTFTVDASISVPAGYELQTSLGTAVGGTKGYNEPITPGTPLVRTNLKAVGDTVYPTIYIRKIADDTPLGSNLAAWVYAGADGYRKVVVPPLDGSTPVVSIAGRMTMAQRVQLKNEQAAAKQMAYSHGSAGVGQSPTLIGSRNIIGVPHFWAAVCAWQGDRSFDALVLAQHRKLLAASSCMVPTSGYNGQYAAPTGFAFAVNKRNPRIWNALNSAERTQTDALMRACLVGGAWTHSDDNNDQSSSGTKKCIMGRAGFTTSGSPNVSNGGSAMIAAAAAYFGIPYCVSYMATYTHATLRAELLSLGLTNAYRTMNWRNEGITSGNFLSAQAPTDASIERSVRGNGRPWQWRGRQLSNLMGIMIDDWGYFSGGGRGGGESLPIQAGINDGAGFSTSKGIRGKIITAWPGGNSAWPNHNQPGLVYEMDTMDGNGIRSSVEYSSLSMRQTLVAVAGLYICDLLDLGNAGLRTYAPVLDRSITDMKLKQQQGYYDWALNGGANSANFTAATHGERWGWDFNIGGYFDFIRPLLRTAGLLGAPGAYNGTGLDLGYFTAPANLPVYLGGLSNRTGAVGTAFTYDASGFFSGTGRAFAAYDLPAGLAINAGTGIISGTPTSTVTRLVTVRADTSSGSDYGQFTLTIS